MNKIQKDNQSRNLRTSDKLHWFRMAKVFSAKKPGPLCAATLQKNKFFDFTTRSSYPKRLVDYDSGFVFIETRQVVATRKLEIFDLQPVFISTGSLGYDDRVVKSKTCCFIIFFKFEHI